MIGTLAGALIAGLIQTMIDFHGNISSWWTKIVVGLLVLTFIILQSLLLRLSTRRLRAV
jgi:galactofuranose transport system permease protein